MGDDIRREGAEQELKGLGHEIKGKVKRKVGDAIDDRSTHIEGAAEELRGKVQKNVGKIMNPPPPERDEDL